jgi:FdhE protein
MTQPYDRRIARAVQLAASVPEATELLTFYLQLARLQKRIFEQEETDISSLHPFSEPLRSLLRPRGIDEFASEETIDLYLAGDRSASPMEQFFARVLLQPYAEYRASRATPDTQTSAARCPFCYSKPGVGVLRGEGEGAKRSLICSLCATEWLFRRVACPNCGETDKDKLPVFIAEQADYVRVEACDSCSAYIKSIDLTRNGHAVPIVDELATVALSIWADERGFTKAEPNLLGL